MESDSELWTAARPGDRTAFGILFERHAKPIYDYSADAPRRVAQTPVDTAVRYAVTAVRSSYRPSTASRSTSLSRS
jgi:hypothetical protein